MSGINGLKASPRDLPDRIHMVDAEISLRAGVILPKVGANYPLHRRHDAIGGTSTLMLRAARG